MGYAVKINNKEWKQIKKKERFVLFLHETKDINILKDGVLYFCLKNDGTNEKERIYGEAIVKDAFSFSDFKTKTKESNLLLDTRDLTGSQYHDDSAITFMDALSKGFEKRSKNLKLFKDKKDKAYFNYAVEMGFAKDYECAKRFEVNWKCAIVFEDIMVYDSPTPLPFFGNIRLARKNYEEMAKECYKATNLRCYQCPYLTMCISENIPLYKYPMLRWEGEIEEIMFLSPHRNKKRKEV